MDKSKIAKKIKWLEGLHSPLEKRIVLAKKVRITTMTGTELVGEVEFIDHYHVGMGNVVLPKHSIEMYEIDPTD